MKILQYNPDNIYKILRQLNDKSFSFKESIAIFCREKEIDSSFILRFFANHWNEDFNCFYLIKEINYISILNLKNGINIWNCGIIIDLEKDCPKEYFYSIINYCLEQNLNIYIHNNRFDKIENPLIHYIGDIYEL